MPKVKCPECGSTDTVWIKYGLLQPTDQLEEDFKNKKFYPGGCDVTLDDPNRFCNSCELEFDTPAHKRSKEGLE